MPGIKRLITRLIATVAVAAVALTLLPSPAAADTDNLESYEPQKNAGDICGYSQDLYLTDANGHLVYERDANGDLILDANGKPIPIPTDKKYLMKFKYKGTGMNRKLVCAQNTDGPGGTAQVLTGTTSSASTIAQIFRGQGSTPSKSLTKRCVDLLFNNAARVPYDGTTNYDDDTQPGYVNPDGEFDDEGEGVHFVGSIHLRTGGNAMNPTYTSTKFNSDATVLDFKDLVIGANLCAGGKL